MREVRIVWKIAVANAPNRLRSTLLNVEAAWVWAAGAAASQAVMARDHRQADARPRARSAASEWSSPTS